jgi:hypothetical protein
MNSFKEYRRQERIKSNLAQNKKNSENGVWDYPDFYMMRKIKENGVWDYPDFYMMRQGSSINEAVYYNKKFHDDSDVKPLNLTPDHINSIVHYTSTGPNDPNGHASSYNMNSYIKAQQGHFCKPIGSHSEQDIKNSIDKLKSAFTPENTNKKIINTTGAVLRQHGEDLESRDQVMLHGFTSTSSEDSVAGNHCNNYKNQNTENGVRHDHIIDYKVHPGCGLSVVNHSNYIENEILLKPGLTMNRISTESHKISPNHILKIHKVEVK